MINAHCEQSSVYWAQHEKKLYKFRILELSEPFCEGRNGETTLSRSCDNVTQKLRQYEKRNHCKRASEPTIVESLPIRAPNRRQTRTQSLPIDLQQLFPHDFPPDNFKGNHKRPQSPLRRKTNGFHNDIVSPPAILIQDSEIKRHNIGCSESVSHSIKTNETIDEITTDNQCTEMNFNLRELSSRYDEGSLGTKSKEELISIILELQDALKLSTED